jgi:outer membrane protein TolC
MKPFKMITIPLGLIMLFSANTFANDMSYREMRQEYERHEAPLFYQQSTVAVSAKPETKEEGIIASELKIKEKEVAELKQRWDAMLKRISEDKNFFDFETEESKRVRKLAKLEEIKEILKQGIALDSLISVAFERNPGLASAKKEWAAALEKYSQATQLDNILQQYQAFIKDLDTKAGPMRHKASVSSKFPFPGTLTLKGDIVTKEVEIAREKYLITLRNLITDIKDTYYELLYSGHAIRITDENLKLLKHLESVAYVKYKTGEAGYSDVVKVQTRTSKLADDLVTWKEYKDTVVAKLNKFLNLPPQFPLGQPAGVELGDTGLSLAELIDLGLKSQQELRVIRLRIDKTNLAIELAEKKFYPDFTLGFSYFEDEQGNLVGVGKEREPFSLKPVTKTNFWFGKNDAYIREARLVYQSLIDELESQQDKLKFSMKALLFQLDTARRDVILYKDSLLVLAKNNLDVAQTDYQSGKADFLDVLDAQRIWLDYNLLYQKYIREQNQNLARLERAIGVRFVSNNEEHNNEQQRHGEDEHEEHDDDQHQHEGHEHEQQGQERFNHEEHEADHQNDEHGQQHEELGQRAKHEEHGSHGAEHLESSEEDSSKGKP